MSALNNQIWEVGKAWGRRRRTEGRRSSSFRGSENVHTNSMVLSSSVQHVNISLNYIVHTGPNVFGLGLVIRLGRDVEGAPATTPADPGGLSWLADSAVLTFPSS